VLDPSLDEVEVRGGSAPGEINNLSVRFLLQGGGAFGRDKSAPSSLADSARGSWTKDGITHDDEVLTVPDAVALVEQAMRDDEVALKRESDAGAAATASADARRVEVVRRVNDLSCTVCGGREFDKQVSREDSQWGYTSFPMTLLICKECGFVLQFSQGRSWFVPDA